MVVSAPVAADRLVVPRGNEIDVDPRSRGEARVGEAAHPRLTYRPDLDGLRALAVIGVLVNHALLPNGTPSGVVGVTAFFVLSGYLITALLLEERDRTGRLDIRAFYGRRIRRLAPGLFVVLAFVTVIGSLGLWHGAWLAGVLTSLIYVGNWAQWLGTDAGPLAHTWTLAIEEQFYLVWPLIVLVGGRRGVVAVSMAGIALAFAVRSGIGDVNYYGNPSRNDAILLGALIAVFNVRVRPATTWLGLGLLLALCVLPLPLSVQLPAAAIAAATVIAGRSPIGFLAPLGRRAYEIYLWDFTLTSLVGLGIGGLLAFPAAEITYRTTARFRRRYAPPETLTIRMWAGFQLPEPPAPAPTTAVPLPVIARIE